MTQGARPDMADVQGYFASLWALETAHKPIRFGEKTSPASLLDLGTRMLAILCSGVPDTTEVVAVRTGRWPGECTSGTSTVPGFTKTGRTG